MVHSKLSRRRCDKARLTGLFSAPLFVDSLQMVCNASWCETDKAELGRCPGFFSHDRENAGEAHFFDDEKAMAESTNIASNINQKIIRAAVEK